MPLAYPQPANPSQAKKAGVWERLMARLDACTTLAALSLFEVDAALTPMPGHWREPLADQIELRRAAIVAEATRDL